MKIIIFLYNRLFDQVIQSNFWLYVKKRIETGHQDCCFYVISFEDSKFPITTEEQRLVESWESTGRFKWVKLKWHSGLSVRSKALDFFNGYLAIFKLRFKGVFRVISVSSVATSFVYLYSRTLPFKRFLYCYEPHAEYARDNGIWSENSFQFKIINLLDKVAARSACIVTSGTSFMEMRIKEEWRYKVPFIKIPTVVDDQKFDIKKKNIELRHELDIDREKYVILYPGKFGDLYYDVEIGNIFKWLLQCETNLFFLIVTPNDISTVRGYMDQAGLDEASYTITSSTYSNIHKFYSISDFGLVAVPPGSSKLFVSNIKVGEYLCSGIPYLITEGISEDFLVARDKNVGVVLKEFSKESVQNSWPKIREFLERRANRSEIERIRKVGVEYRGFQTLNKKFSEALKHLD